MKQSFSTKELAKMWDVSESTVKRWADSGTLPCRKTVGGHRKFEAEDIAAFQNRCGLVKAEAHDANGRTEPSCEFRHLLEEGDYRALAEHFNFIAKLFDKMQEHGLSLAAIGEEVIRPALREIDDLWRTGKIST